MKEERLLTVLGMIDDTFVEELYRSEEERPSNPVSKRKIRVYFLVAAIILLLAACGVKAVAILEENWFPQYFSEKYRDDAEEMISENQRELLEQGLVPIGQSVTCNGYTLTLESALSDGYRSFLKFRLTAPEGVDLDGARYNLEGLSQITHADGKEIEFSVEGGDEYSLPDRKDPDNTIAILYESSVVPQTDSAEKMKLGTVWNITITNVYEYAIREDNAEQYYDLRKEISGEWSFHFTFDENTLLGQEQEILEDPIYCLGKRILWERSFPVIVKITSYKIRAFGATLRFEMPLLGVWEGVEHGPVFIFLKDGTVVEGHFRAGFDRGDYWENNYEFPIPITPADISYVQFPGGQKVFLTEEGK